MTLIENVRAGGQSSLGHLSLVHRPILIDNVKTYIVVLAFWIVSTWESGHRSVRGHVVANVYDGRNASCLRHTWHIPTSHLLHVYGTCHTYNEDQ